MKNLKIHTSTNANAFASTFYFFSTHKDNAEKNKKSLQATAPDSADISGKLTRQTDGRKEERTDNKGFKEIGGSEVNQTFVHLIKFCGGRQFCAPKSPTS